MKKLTAMLLVIAVMMMIVAGCSKGGSNVAGKYKLKSYTEGGETMSVEELSEMLEGTGMSIDEMFSLELKSDGTFSISMMGEDPVSGTYKVDGEKIAMTAEGETLNATIKGSELTMAQDGVELVFTK